jgi:hypothetical protein
LENYKLLFYSPEDYNIFRTEVILEASRVGKAVASQMVSSDPIYLLLGLILLPREEIRGIERRILMLEADDYPMNNLHTETSFSINRSNCAKRKCVM